MKKGILKTKRLIASLTILTFILTSVSYLPNVYAVDSITEQTTDNTNTDNNINLIKNSNEINITQKTDSMPVVSNINQEPPGDKTVNELDKFELDIPKSEVTILAGDSDDFIHGNSVMYNLLKKTERLDLLGKSMDVIKQELEGKIKSSKSKYKDDKNNLTKIEPVYGLIEQTSDYETDRFIIKHKEGKSTEGKEKISESIQDNVKEIKENKYENVDLLVTKAKVKQSDLYHTLQEGDSLDSIEYIQPDFQVALSSDDTYFPLQWGLLNENTVGPDNFHVDVNVVPAWEVVQGEGVVVAVIDTGLDITHEDITANIDPNGWNFVDDNNIVHNVDNLSDEMHATNLAGIIGAVKDNAKGVAGAAPYVKILPLKVFTNGTAYTSDIIDAIKYAEEKGVKIVNCSWGMSGDNLALKEAMAQSNMLFICAAGNSANDIDQTSIAPASFDLPNIITVGAINDSGNLTSFSNYGFNNVDVAAPGEDIVTTGTGNIYVVSSGTSMAAAFVSAEAALLLSQNKDISITEIKDKILRSSDHLSSLNNKIKDANKININNAITGVNPTITVEIPIAEEKPQIPSVEDDYFKLYDTQRAWYNNLVGPSAVNGVQENKYSAWGSFQETISPQTGDLTIHETDITLPGRNGLNLSISRLYQSNLSIFGDRKISGDLTYAYNDYSTYTQNRYNLGLGWSFGFPSVQIENDDNGEELYYHTGTGPVYHVEFTPDSSDSNLEFYTKKDVLFDTDLSYTNGQVYSKYVFKTSDNTKRYFAADGRLLAIVDRFGNDIKFTHIERPVTNRAPNNDFAYPETAGVWTTNSNYSYDNTTGMGDTTSLKFNSSYSIYTSSSVSKYIEVLPNTKYYLGGYILNQLNEGNVALTYRQYYGNYQLLSEGTRATVPVSSNWQLTEQYFVTDPDAKYIQIEFINYNNVQGSSWVDKVRFDRAWPLISEIEDTIGRHINFDYNDTLYTDSSDAGNITVTVHDPANTNSYTMTYNRDVIYCNFNWKFINGVGNYTESRRYPWLHYAYNGETYKGYGCTMSLPLEYYSYWEKTQSSYSGSSLQALVNEIYLRNSRIKYEYAKVAKHLGEDGFYETSRITKRYEQQRTSTGYTGSNYEQNYTYSGSYNGTTYDNETGYNGPYTLSENPDFLFASTMQQPNGLKVETIYKGKYEYKTAKYKTSESGSEIITKTNETYDINFPDLPTKVKIEEQNSSGTNTLYVGYTYNSWGGLASETKPLTQAQWDNATYKEQQTIYYEYESTYKFLTSKEYYQNANTQLTDSITYDSLGRISSKQNAEGEITTFYYEDTNHTGNLTKINIALSGGKNSTTNYAYDSSYSAYVTDTTDHYTENETSKTAVTHKTFEFLRGNILTATDARNNTVTYAYDSQGRPSRITYPSSTDTTGTYTVEENYNYGDYLLTSSTDSSFNNQVTFGVGVEKTQKYSEQSTGSVYAATYAYYTDHGDLMITYDYMFDEINDWVKQRVNNFNAYGQLNWSKDARGYTTNYSFDEWGRIKSVTDAMDNQQKVTYDIYNRSKLASFLPYDSSTEENQYKENFDQWGRIIARTGYPNGINDSNIIQEKYEYDLVGNLTELKDARNNSTQFSYDGLNRLVKVINALGEIADYDYDRLGPLNLIKQYQGEQTFQTTKVYDERGLIISKQLPTGNPTTYKYNENSLPTEITEPKGTVEYFDYDNNSRLLEKRIDTEKVHYYYNVLGGVEKYEVWHGTNEGEHLYYDYFSTGLIKERKEGTYSTTFSYDLNGNQSSVTDPFGLSVSYAYDSVNRATSVTTDSKNFIYEYYKDGMIKAVNYPQVGGATLRTEYTYDNINRLLQLKNVKNSVTISQYDYVYDNNGNITSVTEAKGGEAVTTEYEYDTLNRLITIERPDQDPIGYQYDSRGNRLQTTGATLDENYINSIREKVGDTYQFAYDAENLRTKKITPDGTTRYHLDNAARVITESDATDQVTAQNIWGHKMLARRIGSNYYFYLYNGHGDVVQIIDESGNIVNSYTYDEWGNITEKTEGISNPIRYAGEYQDDESGLYYLRARYYDPTIGRFITRDSYEGDISNPLSINQYAYCVNNPLIYVDPSGFKEVLLRDKIEKAGGTIEWDPVDRIATAIIGGEKVVYDPDHDDNIYINAQGRIVIDDRDLDEDFSDVVNHISVDSRLGMTKLDVYTMRRDFSNTVLKRTPEILSQLPDTYYDIFTSPEFRQAAINTSVVVIDRTPLGGFRKAYNLIPGVPQIKADEETERALKQVSLLKVSTIAKVYNWVSIFTKKFFH